MEKNIAVILALNTLTVVFGWVIYLAGVPPNTNLFIFAAESIMLLGLISLAITFIYVFMSGNRNKLFLPALIVLGGGVILTFFAWFIGGLVVLISLLLLILSKRTMYKRWGYIALIFSGFLILTIVPPIEAFLNVYALSMDYGVIIFSVSLIVAGLCLLSKKTLDLEGNLIFIILSISFFLLPPFHEIFKIKSNGSFGIYDNTIIIASTIVYVIFAVGLIYASIKKDKIMKVIDEGYKLLERGKWEDAYGLFRKISENGYRDAKLFNGIGIALMHLGKFDDAEVFLRESVNMEDNDVYLTNLGNLHYRKGDVDRAMKIYSKVLKRNPDCYLALNNMGRALMKKGKKEEAEKYLKKAIKINPNGKTAKRNYSMINGE